MEPNSLNLPRITILGAGPIGLECALYARTLGFPVTVLEQGAIGEHVRRWSSVRMFSPWKLNASPLALERLRVAGSEAPIEMDACPTGNEFLHKYLLPLSGLPELEGCIQTGTRVVACARQGIGKSFLPSSARKEFPFRVLVEDPGRRQSSLESDIIIDSTGSFGNPAPLGDGGIPAPGESELETFIDRYPVEPGESIAERYADKTVLLVGAGFSAATTLESLIRLQTTHPATRIVWACRSENRRPLHVIEDDPLPERARLSRFANDVADNAPNNVVYRGGMSVHSLRKRENAVDVRLADLRGNEEAVLCDRIISNVGYRPDASLYRELQVHECYATFGPIDLAASLLAQPDGNCLQIQSGGPDLLRNPEPNFYILGAKSYGTNSAFLLRTGHEQIAQIFSLITGKPELNLYTE